MADFGSPTNNGGSGMRRWSPLRAHFRFTPPTAGELIAHIHAVWEVELVDLLERALWNDADEAAWEQAGYPDLWPDGPYRVHARFVGGLNPNPGKDRGALTIHTDMTPVIWHVYKSARWPKCSCCGEPMPCRTELADQQIDADMAAFDANSRKIPGACWSCSEPITHRQQAVVFAGVNLDLPGGPVVRFHTRQSCIGSAMRYEVRWRADDPTRPRLVTWPKCPGTLFTHQDGSQECMGGIDTCHGWDHDHRAMSACYAQSHGCGRDCGSEGHPGARGPRRPRVQQRAMETP